MPKAPLGSEGSSGSQTLTHLDGRGRARMVDVGEKDVTRREALAMADVLASSEVLQSIREGRAAKGDVLATARIAGIQAAKRTADLIPLCHPLRLDQVIVDLTVRADRVAVRARVLATDRTGVEMEALTAAAAAALTVYDMCKALDREMVITGLCLLEKSGGRSGHFRRRSPAAMPPGRQGGEPDQ